MENTDSYREIIRQIEKLSFFGSSKKATELFEQLAETKQLAAIPPTTEFLLSYRKTIRDAARKTISRLLANLKPHELASTQSLDSITYDYHWASIAPSTHHWANNAWAYLPTSEAGKTAGNPEDEGYSAILGLLSFHSSGYRRELAVQKLSQVRDGSEIPYLLIRLNDWVSSIANQAKTAILDRITTCKEANSPFVTNLPALLPLILNLKSFSRYDHSDILFKTRDVILAPKHMNLREELFRQQPRKALCELVLSRLPEEASPETNLLRLGLRSSAPKVRLACVQIISNPDSNFQNGLSPELLAWMENDAFAPLRRETFHLKAQSAPNSETEIWKQALLDRSQTIRELARFQLKKLGCENEIAKFYREHLVESPTFLPALEGLAESGDASDANFFRELLKHPFPSRRRLAARGLYLAVYKDALPDLFPLLKDESPKVVRRINKLLEPHLHSFPTERIFAVATSSDGLFARKNAIQLLAKLGKWKSMPWLLQVACKTDSQTVTFCEEMINSWFIHPKCNRNFTKPTHTEAELINHWTASAEGHLSPKNVSRIRKELALWG